MGATVSVGKKVAAFEMHGKVIYALFESTYEKNCYPHTPRWGCIALAEYEDALKRIFYYGGACESGYLQNSRGQMKADNYIADWLHKMRAPMEFVQQSVTLEKSWGSVSDDNLDAVCALLEANQYDAEITDLRAGKRVNLSFEASLPLILLLAKKIAPWRMVDYWAVGSVLAQLPLPVTRVFAPALELSIPAFYRLEHHASVYIIRQGKNKQWEYAGTDWQCLNNFIENEAVEFELRRSGAGCSAIKAMRNAIEAAPKLTLECNIRMIFDPRNIQDWKRSWFAEQNLSLVDGFHVMQIDSSQKLYYVGDIPGVAVAFDVPTLEAA